MRRAAERDQWATGGDLYYLYDGTIVAAVVDGCIVEAWGPSAHWRAEAEPRQQFTVTFSTPSYGYVAEAWNRC